MVMQVVKSDRSTCAGLQLDHVCCVPVGGSKAGPPPVKCTYAKGPKGINKVCT